MLTQPRSKGPSVGRSLPPGGTATFLLTWLPRVPRQWCRVLGGGSQLLSGLGTWPGRVQSGMQQMEGETSVWSLGSPEFAGSFSLETWGWGRGKQVSSGENTQSYTPYRRTGAMQAPAPPMGKLTPEPPEPACCEALRKTHPEAVVSSLGKGGWSCRAEQTLRSRV